MCVFQIGHHDVASCPSHGSFHATFLKNCGGGHDFAILCVSSNFGWGKQGHSPCIVVVGCKQGHAPCKVVVGASKVMLPVRLLLGQARACSL